MILDHACRTGKKAYTSKFEADQAATRIASNVRRRRASRRGRLRAYRCDFCPHFHVGNADEAHRREAA